MMRRRLLLAQTALLCVCCLLVFVVWQSCSRSITASLSTDEERLQNLASNDVSHGSFPKECEKGMDNNADKTDMGRSAPTAEKMLEDEKVISIALGHARTTSNTNQMPEIELREGVYIASYKRYDNPFRGGDPGFDCRIAIDALSGKLISVQGLNRGAEGCRMSRRTGVGLIDEAPQAKIYQERVSDALRELHRRIQYGHPLASSPQSGMINQEKAVQRAREQVADRKFDPNKSPWPILINDIYIVTFWRYDEDVYPEWGNLLYDSRVGIDAKTGGFVAMDITRKKR
jgi:hypothetical protein